MELEVGISVCLVVLCSVARCSEGQSLTATPELNVDDATKSTKWRSSTSTVTEPTTGMEPNCCVWNQTTPSLDPTDQYSSGLQEEGLQNNTAMITEEWLWEPWGRTWWVIVQMVTAGTGILGNLLVIILLFHRRKKSRATDTLIGALATADFFTSIFMIPHPISERVSLTILGKIYCKLISSMFFMWTSTVASIMTLTFIPIERYIAVVYPLRCKELLSRTRIRTAIVLSWLMGITLHSPFAYTNYLDPSQQQCVWTFSSKKIQNILGVVLFVFEFLIPMIVNLTLQMLTAHALHRQAQLYLGADRRLDEANPSARHILAKKRVLQTVSFVVILFIVCWGPVLIGFLAFDLGLLPETYLGSTRHRVLVILGFCNSCANPFIYAVRNPEFRKATRELFNPKRNEAPLFDDRAAKSTLRGTNVV